MTEKIELNIGINPEFKVQYGEVYGTEIEVEIWDDGDVLLEDGKNRILINIEALAEIVKATKIFQDKRTAYLNKDNNTLTSDKE